MQDMWRKLINKKFIYPIQHKAMPDTKKIYCLVVDDEPLALDVLKNYISLVSSLELAGTCNNAVEALNILQQKHIDLIFLDIQMPQLLGTDLIRTLTTPPRVIFTTAYRKFAVEGFELDAVDYLLKPISFERFLKAVNKIMKSNGHTMLEEKTAMQSSNGFLYFRSERKMIKVFVDDILFIESLRDYIKIYRKNDKPLLVKQSISTLELKLPQDLFLRVHRSFIVAINKISAFTNQDIEIGQTEIPIGRVYSLQVEKLLSKSK